MGSRRPPVDGASCASATVPADAVESASARLASTTDMSLRTTFLLV